MSMKSNEKQQRVSDGAATEASQGLSFGSAFEDPTGLFPRPEYYNSTSVSYAAVGAKRNDLTVFATAPGVDYKLGTPVPSEYPYNQSRETSSGHVVEIDDTPGNERILISHKDKFGIELRPDGTILITAKNNKVESVGGDLTIVVEGDANLTYKGNLSTEVYGDYNINVRGDTNISVAGNRTASVGGSDRGEVSGSFGWTVTGGYSVTAVQQATMTFLGGMSQNVKGTFSNNVDGSANYVSSGNAAFTSEGQANMSAPDINVAASNLSVFGGSGTIGGEGIHIYGYNARIENTVAATSMSASTFHGSLEGTARDAQEALTAAALGSVTIGPLTSVAVNTEETSKPTASIVSDYLSKAAGGIRKVKIDVGDFIKNFIDKTVANGGVSSKKVTTAAARSRLRDPANRSNSDFTGNLIGDQTICTSYDNPTPQGIGRVIKGGATPEDGATSAGSKTTRRSFKPTESMVELSPDQEFNPDYAGDITSKTKLAPSITMAKFLGSDDPTNLNFIKSVDDKKKLARYYYVHAQIMRTLQLDNSKFKEYNLVVSEGLYRPGPEENVTADSVNDLKLKGRAVVYNIVDKNGQSDTTALFDLAVYWKSKIYYDKMILSYDSINCSLSSRLIIILPELDDNWNGTARRIVETEYNGTKLSQGELVEVLPFATSGSSGSSTTDGSSQSNYQYTGSGQIIPNPNMNPIFTANGQQSTFLKPGAEAIMQNDTIPRVKKVAELFGKPLVINDALAKRGTTREKTTQGSQHFYGRAVDISTRGMSNSEKIRLFEAAKQAGFTGFGFGNTILHIDTGDKRAWDYGNSTYGGVSTSTLKSRARS